MTAIYQPPFIPQEILAIIFQDKTLTQQDLYVLLTGSRTFYAEVKRIIYRFVELRNVIQVKSFCAAVESEPHHAQDIHRLSLSLPDHYPTAHECSQMTKLLRLCVNLRDFRVFSYKADRCPTDESWALERFPFKLTTFVNGYFNQQKIHGFLKYQPTIETHIQVNEGIDGIIWNQTPYPALKNLSFDLYLDFLLVQQMGKFIGGPLERLQIRLRHNVQIWAHILREIRTHFGASLKALSADVNDVRDPYMYTDMRPLVEEAEIYFPDLKFLEIVASSLASEDLTYSTAWPTATASTQLETLVLHLPVSESAVPSLDSFVPREHFIDLMRTDTLPMAGVNIMHTLPTLKRLVLVDQNSFSYEVKRTDGVVSFVGRTKPSSSSLDTLLESEWLTADI